MKKVEVMEVWQGDKKYVGTREEGTHGPYSWTHTIQEQPFAKFRWSENLCNSLQTETGVVDDRLWTTHYDDLIRKEPTVSAKCKECLAEVTLDNVEEFRRDKEGGWVHRHPSVCTATLRGMVKGHEVDIVSLRERVATLEKACWDRNVLGISKDSFLYRIRKLEEKASSTPPRQKILGIF